MRIIFFGTPEFAIPTLQKLHKSNHEVLAVVTVPDKPRGRGRSISISPVKKFAVDHNMMVLAPEKLNDSNFLFELEKLKADLFVVVAFRILPEKVFNLPKFGSFNLHGSLLPKYRGAAPIQWAIINGEKETGLTTFFLKSKVDTGNIILKRKIEIKDSDNLGSLHDKMSLVGADLVLETVELINSDKVNVILQDNSLATPAPKIKKEICEINWSNSAVNIHNLIRGLSPYPCAFFISKNKIFKVFKSGLTKINELDHFEIKETKDKLFIGTASEDLQILELQPEGRKRMTTEEFLRGYSLL